MMSSKKSIPFKNKLTVDFLFNTCLEHQELVEVHALSQLHNIELAMPKFNTLASLSKSDFNKFLGLLKKKNHDVKAFLVMVAAVTDTLTCMIHSSKLYENFAEDNEQVLELLIRLLFMVKGILSVCGDLFGNLDVLIGILEKSADRIKNSENYYNVMQEIIRTLKVYKKNMLSKENGCKNDCDNLKENSCAASNADPKVEDQKPSLCVPLQTKVDNNDDCKPKNVFEIMMISSKMMKKKQKGKV